MKNGEMSWEEFQQLKKSVPVYKFNVITGSMDPILPVGEIVIVEITEKVELHDIVVFWQDGKLVCHVLWHRNRILNRPGEDVWVTRAAVGKAWDLSIKPEQVLGKVINHQLSWWWILRLRARDYFARRRKKVV